MGTILALIFAAQVYGVPPEVVLGLAHVESRFQAGAVNRQTGCAGLLQVQPRYSPYPRWTLTTTLGGALAGCHALREWRRLCGRHALRGFGTGSCVKGAKYEAAVLRAAERFRRALGLGGEA